MAITTGDGLVAAPKDPQSIKKTATRVSVAAAWFSVLDLAGNPGAGVLAGTNTAAGVAPDDLTAGMPLLRAFGGGATGYLEEVSFGNTVASRAMFNDLLWKGGAYPFNAAQALSG